MHVPYVRKAMHIYVYMIYATQIEMAAASHQLVSIIKPKYSKLYVVHVMLLYMKFQEVDLVSSRAAVLIRRFIYIPGI